jgi:RPEL repeat
MSSTEQSVTPAIDETPISPIKEMDLNPLEKQLSSRPEAQELKDRNILKPTYAAP